MFVHPSSQTCQNSILRQKRDQFANEIRRKKRDQIIKQKRKVLMHDLLVRQTVSLSSQQKTILSNIPAQQLFKKIKSNQNKQLCFQQISKRLQSPNNNYTFITSSLFQYGIHYILIKHLNARQYLQQILSILSIIFSKDNLRYAERFVDLGLLEILIEILPQRKENIRILFNILRNICIEDQGFSEIILQNRKHLLCIEIFNQLYTEALYNHNNIHQNISKQLIKMFDAILEFLDVISGIKDTSLDFSEQYQQIVDFNCGLLANRVFIKRCMEILYLLGGKIRDKVINKVTGFVNQLLCEQTGQSQHCQELFIIIETLSPADFRYDLVFSIPFTSTYEILKRSILILQKLGQSQTTHQISRNEQWWSYALTKIDQNRSQFQIIISLMRKLNINYQCVWRFMGEYLDNTIYSINKMKQILLFLRNHLINVMNQNLEKRCALLNRIVKYKIDKQLQKIALKENYVYASKAQELIHIIQNMQKDIKGQYEIDIE